VITIRVGVDASNLEAYRRSLDRLVRDLRRLERDSPFKLDIIGYRRGVTSISMIRQPSRTAISAALRAAHRDVAPRLYSASVAQGGPLQPRVEAAEREITSMRQAAIEEIKRASFPALKSRREYSREYAIAHAIFSPAAIRERFGPPPRWTINRAHGIRFKILEVR
jgi:hypothetical protein